VTVETRTWLGYTFAHQAIIEPERDCDGRVAGYAPAQRHQHHASKRLNPWGHGPFCSLSLPLLPIESGVYSVTENGDLAYFGQTGNLRQRWGKENFDLTRQLLLRRAVDQLQGQPPHP
jgi:hypothetical protein